MYLNISVQCIVWLLHSTEFGGHFSQFRLLLSNYPAFLSYTHMYYCLALKPLQLEMEGVLDSADRTCQVLLTTGLRMIAQTSLVEIKFAFPVLEKVFGIVIPSVSSFLFKCFVIIFSRLLQDFLG